MTKCINNTKRPASNIIKGEFKALQDLKADNDITILPADKGRSTVILNTKDYESKMSTLFSDTNTYEVLKNDPTPKLNRELTEMIRGWQSEHPNHTHLKQYISPHQKKSQIGMAYQWSSTNNCRKPKELT